MEDVFPTDIGRPTSGVKLLGGPVSCDHQYCSDLVFSIDDKTFHLMNSVRQLKDPQSEIFLLRNCTRVSKLYFTLRTTSPQVLQAAITHYDHHLRKYLQHLITCDGAGFGPLQQRLVALPMKYGGFGIYTLENTSQYYYLASLTQTHHLQTNILNVVDLSAPSHNYQHALNKFMHACGLSSFSISSTAPHPMKTLEAQFFDVVKKDTG